MYTLAGKGKPGWSLEERAQVEGWGEMASDESFSRVTEEHLLDAIHKGMAKVKENQSWIVQ